MPPDAPSRGSERRVASVMFADISGFTAMSEKSDPEDVTAVMNQCFEMLEVVVRDHGGYVDKYIGDCIMALFGVPNALEDAAARAVNAAIEIRGRVRELSTQQRLPAKLDVHIGINTGLVIAGEVGGAVKRDFTVMGDTVNVASRLKDKAPNGTIWVGSETYRHTREQFDYRELPPLEVKGKEEALTAFEVRSEHERIHRPKRAGAERRIASELVGRETELQLLTDAIALAGRGRGGIVNVIGEAGIGKSRLVAEATVQGRSDQITILEGRSLALGHGLSFHPFIDLLRQWAGISEDEATDDPAVVAKLEISVRAVLGPDADEVFPFIANLMGMRPGGAYAERLKGIQGEALEKVTLKNLRALFLRMAATTPLVLVFEDLHWADLSSIRFLEPLFRLVEHSRMLFVNAFRPDHEDTSDRILKLTEGQLRDRTSSIRLDRLTDKECDALIFNLLKRTSIPYETRTLIRQKAEGNPFFIEEVIRSLIDDGIIEYGTGQFRVTDRIASVVIPGTIQDVIMSRVDRLDGSTREALQVASVIGRSFYHRIVADLLAEHPDLDRELATLKDKQLIFERRTRRTATVRRRMLTDEVEYVFKHALAQETVYESILQKTRKELHLKVAESIERNFADRLADFYGMLAYHFSRAESLERAEAYLFKAGDEAARAAASSEALTYFREASRLYLIIHADGGDPARRALLEKNIGLALLNKGELMECIPHFDAALELLGVARPSSRIGTGLEVSTDLLAVLYRLYVPRRRRGPAGSLERDQEVLRIQANRARAQATSDPHRFFMDTIASVRRLNQTDAAALDEAWWMYAGAAALFAFSGVSFRASARFLDVAERLVPKGNPKDLFVYRSMRYVHHYLRGDWDVKHAIANDLVDQALRYGQLWDVCTYLGHCDVKTHQGAFGEVDDLIKKLVEIGDVFAYDFARSFEYAYTAIQHLERRCLDEALAAADVYYTSRHEDVMNILALGLKAKIYVLQGKLEAAERTLEATEALITRAGRVSPWHLSEYALSRLHCDLDRFEHALASGERGAARLLGKRAQASGKRTIRIAKTVAKARTEGFRLAGRLSWLFGRRDKAMAWWARSLAEGERLGVRPEIARTHLEIAERLGLSAGERQQVNGLDAQTCLESARRSFTEMNLQWDLARLGALERRAA